MSDSTYGGFFVPNIKRAVIKECLESGDPRNYFLALQEVVENIQNAIDLDENFWDKIYDRSGYR